jgi:hypothetical protein
MGGDLMAQERDVPGYTEVKVLGSGGFGEVVLARHDGSGTPVSFMARTSLPFPLLNSRSHRVRWRSREPLS